MVESPDDTIREVLKIFHESDAVPESFAPGHITESRDNGSRTLVWITLIYLFRDAGDRNS